MIPSAALCKLLGLDPESTKQIALESEGGNLVVRAWVTDKAGMINVTSTAYKLTKAKE